MKKELSLTLTIFFCAEMLIGVIALSHRQGTNLIINGGFQSPIITPNWGVFVNPLGWTGNVQIGRGGIYNSRWNSQVVELDVDTNELIEQKINLKSGAYLLKYQYAAREGLVPTSQMKVYWNGVVIDNVVPQNEKIVSKSIVVLGISGANTVGFQGAGPSDGLGMTIDNIGLYFVSNLIVNGGFQLPRISPNWGIFVNPPGWTGNVEIGRGTIYNSRWNTQVVELDVSKNQIIKQDINLGAGIYKLKYQYSARAGLVATSQMKVYWNGVLLQNAIPNNEQIVSKEISVQGKDGTNTVTFEGTGASDGLGMIIDNVQLYASNNLIINGDFQLPTISPNWRVYTNPPGWTGKVEIGRGTIYNSRWNSQVTELDVDSNELIQQDVFLSGGKYVLKYEYAARAGLVGTSQMKVYWNGVVIQTAVPTDQNIVSKEIVLDGTQGKNTVGFEGSGASDGLGMTLDNVKLTVQI